MQRAWSVLETLLRRHAWVVTFVTLIPCAYFAARGVNNALADKLFKTDVTGLTRGAAPSLAEVNAASTGPGGAPAAPSFHVRDTNRMLSRNVFDSDAGCLNCPDPVPAAGTTAAQTPTDGGAGAPPVVETAPEPCTGQARVLGAVQAEDPLWSFVFMSPGGAQPSMPYRWGQMFDGKTVTTIGWHRYYGAFVILRQGAGGPRCFYAQTMPPRQAPPTPPPSAQPRPAAPAGEESGALSAVLDRITPAGPNEYNIPRSAVNAILENQAELMRTTRIMPQQEGGRTVGVQMFGVRGNSLLGRLGMQNGDVLNQINGLDIASPDRALEAYSRLRTADHITLSVTRNGAPQNLDFNIR